MPGQEKPFEIHAVVELLGHRQIAGRVTEQPLAGTNMLRVDVPAVGDWPAFTKYFGGGSIYAIHPCTEEIATATAEQLASQWGYTPMPVAVPDLSEASRVIREARAARSLAPAAVAVGLGDDEADDPEYGHDRIDHLDAGF